MARHDDDDGSSSFFIIAVLCERLYLISLYNIICDIGSRAQRGPLRAVTWPRIIIIDVSWQRDFQIIGRSTKLESNEISDLSYNIQQIKKNMFNPLKMFRQAFVKPLCKHNSEKTLI